MNGGLAAPPPTGASLSSSRKAQLSQQAGEFMTIARSIGRDIAATYTKLEKLTLLARRKTLFDDRPQEIQKLTVIIKEDMATLNKQVRDKDLCCCLLSSSFFPAFRSPDSNLSPRPSAARAYRAATKSPTAATWWWPSSPSWPP